MRNGMAWTVFPTAIGFVGLAWGEAGLLGAQLPEADEAGTRARMARRFPALVEVGPADLAAAAAQAIGGITALLAGEPRDLLEIALDLRGVPDFNRRVYALARRIPPGRTRSYGELARQHQPRAGWQGVVACQPVGRPFFRKHKTRPVFTQCGGLSGRERSGP